uniref:Uncharacterized protein n=1 Tax=Avena sativa TaxID=4498 RepID=A0ACD5UCP5_AVESA
METEVEMEIDPVRTSESKGGRPAEDLEEALRFVSRKKVKIPETIESVLAEELKDLEEELSLAARTERENRKQIKIVKGMGPLEIDEALSIGHRRKLEKPEKGGNAVHEWQPEAAELEEALSLAARSGLMTEEVSKFLRVAVLSNLTDHDVHSLAIKSGLEEEDAVSLAITSSPCTGSFGRFIKERKSKGPEAIPFLLFKIKASARNAKVAWWRKEYAHFPPERAGYTDVLRVARLVVGRDGSSRLEEAGEDGQPGALSHGRSRYSSSDRRVGVLRDGWLSPLDEVAIVRRLPGGDGISVMSCVNGLGVKLGEFLFVLHVAWTVALSFTERSFCVSSKFMEEKLYAVPGVNFIDITVPVENLIKKLYQMYEKEERDRKMTLDQQGPQERQEMMCQHEELGSIRKEERGKKMEDLLRKQEERKRQKLQRKEKREMFHQMKMATRIGNEQRQNEEFEGDCFMCLEDCDWLPGIG